MGRTTSLTVLLLAFFAGPVWAQETARERARATLSPTVFGEVEALAIQADREGIPSEPLFNKALEGAAKGVRAERLLPALNAYATRLRTAHRAFGPTASASLVVAGADALQRGVESEALGRLGRGEGGGPGPSPMAVLVLADLVEAGVPAERALGVLQEALRMRTREQQMLGIPGQVRQLMRQGQSPQEAADQVRRALQRGRGGGGVGPPVPPGSEPVTRDRQRRMKGRGGG
jgi:hypothetical protein